MKIKMMPIFVFILIFIGTALMGNSLVYAEDCTATGIDLLDDCCNSDEQAQQLCFETQDGYIIQVYPGEGEDDVVDDAGDSIWPIRDTANNTLTFQYKAFWPGGDCKGVDTWNYFVQRQSISIAYELISSEPSGAQLILPGSEIPKCKTTFFAEEGSGEGLLKLNPSLNCGDGNEVIFSFTYSSCTFTGRNESTVVTKSGCEPGNFILGPSPELLPFHAEQRHKFPDGGFVDVVFEPAPCSAPGEVLVKKVTIDDKTYEEPEGRAWICTPAPDGSTVYDEYIVDHPDLGLLLCIEPEKAGLQKQGCVVDANPRSYLYGGDVYTGR